MFDSTEVYSSNSVPVDIQPSPVPDGQAVCIVSFSYSLLGNNGGVDAEKVQTTAKKKRLKVSKQLLESPELEAIRSHCCKRRNKILRRCIMSVGRNSYVMPLRLVAEVAEEDKQDKSIFDELVKTFIAVFPDRVEEARADLAEDFKEWEYPAIESLPAEFRWSTRYMAFGSPTGLKEISRDVWEQEQEQTRAFWAEARQALRESFLGLIQHATNALSYGDKGKPAIFRDSMVSNMQEFMRIFSDLNQTNDGELTALVDKARAVMAGVGPDTLRSNLGVRDRVREQFETVKVVLTDSLVAKPSRAISFSDDD